MSASGDERGSGNASAGTLAAAECATVIAALQRLGVDTQLVLARAGLNAGLLDEPFARVPAAQEHALWAAAEQVTGDPAIGLRVGIEHARHGARNLVEYVVLHAPTLRQALGSAQSVLALLDDRGHIDVAEEGDRARLLVYRDGLARARGYADSLLAGAVVFGSEHIDGMRLLDVAFTQPRPVNVRPYVEVFGRLPRFGAARNELVIPRSVLDQKLKGADPIVGELLREHAQQLLDRVSVGDPFVDGARRALARQLTAGHANPEEVARAIGVSPRTLRRKLSASGTTYHELLDELRCELSCHLLSHGTESIDAITERLGFSSRSGFQRAFRRYTGQSPSEYRAAKARVGL